MKSKYVAIFACFVVSFVVAGLFIPADPVTWYLWGAAIFVVSVLFHRLGVRCGRQAAESPHEQNVAGKRRWFHFSLGTLLTIVAVGAILVAGETWRRQLDRRAISDSDLMYQLNGIISRPTEKVDHWSGGGGCDDEIYGIVSGSHYWVFPAGNIPKDFLATITTKLTDELRNRGMEVRVYSLGGGSHITADERCYGNRVNYSSATLCGTIVLRLAAWDGQNPTGFLFIDKSQFFR